MLTHSAVFFMRISQSCQRQIQMISHRLLFLLALWFAGALPAYGDEEASVDPLLFVTAEVWPWGYRDAEDRPAGKASDLAARLAESAGLPLDNRILPYQRVLFEFQQGEADFAILFENPELESFAINLGEVIQTVVYLVALRDSNFDLDLVSLQGKKVGHIRGTVYGNAFEQDENIVRVPVSNMVQAIDMLRRNRLDALVSSDFAFTNTLNAMKLSEDEFRIQVLTGNQAANLYMSRRPRHPEHGTLLMNALQQMKLDGDVQSPVATPDLRP